MMKSDIKLQKELLSPPGNTIKETIDNIGMSQIELAERMGKDPVKINEIIKGKEPITNKTALKLEKVLGIPVNFWLNREQEYRIELARIEEEETMEKNISWLENFPVRYLKKIDILPNTRQKNELAKALLQFFGVVSPDEWRKIYINNNLSLAYRASNITTRSPEALSVWLRWGEKESEKMDLPDFHIEIFKNILKENSLLIKRHPINYETTLQHNCKKAGVALVFTPSIPKAPINGASRWFHGNPLIQISDRYKSNDQFWFSFYHEAGHIIKHGKKELFLENIDGLKKDAKKEQEANLFAQKWLFPKKALNEMQKLKKVTEKDILKFAEKYQTHPGIIVGQLQRFQIIPYNRFNHLKIKIDLMEN